MTLSERIPHVEVLIPEFRVVDLLKMNPPEKARFQLMVEKSGGHLEVFVHPWFEEKDSDPQYPVTSDYKQARTNLIQSCLENGVPLVIFDGQIEALSRHFVFQKTGVIYAVKTIGGEPTPKNGFRFPWQEVNHQKSWQPVLNILKEAGVMHVTVGGRYLTLHKISDERFLKDYREWVGRIEGLNQRTHAKTWLGENFLPQGCVAGAAHWLLTRFDVSLSPTCSPHRLSPSGEEEGKDRRM